MSKDIFCDSSCLAMQLSFTTITAAIAQDLVRYGNNDKS
jgi:hypothetical protein